MANTIEADHDKAFEEARELSPLSVTFNGGDAVEGISPQQSETSLERDADGALDAITEREITVRKSDIPSINAQTTAVLDDDSNTYRVRGFRNAGQKALTLILESP